MSLTWLWTLFLRRYSCSTGKCNSSLNCCPELRTSSSMSKHKVGGNSSERRRKNAVGPSGSLVPEPITSYTSGATGTSGSGGVGGSKPTEETNRSSNSSKMKPRFMNLDHIKNPFSDEAIDTFFQKSDVSFLSIRSGIRPTSIARDRIKETANKEKYELTR